MSIGVQLAIILAVVLVIAIFLRYWFAIGKQMAISVLVIAGVGILTHYIGEMLPRRWFDPEKFPYRERPWERHGHFYEKFGIRVWKDHMPDKSKWVKSTYTKTVRDQSDPESLDHLLRETCVAECVHWGLLFISPVILLFTQGTAAVIITIVYGFSNLPLIMIQRFNRPRLRTVLRRTLRAAEKGTIKE